MKARLFWKLLKGVNANHANRLDLSISKLYNISYICVIWAKPNQ